jgi:hypothetical protein
MMSCRLIGMSHSRACNEKDRQLEVVSFSDVAAVGGPALILAGVASLCAD